MRNIHESNKPANQLLDNNSKVALFVNAYILSIVYAAVGFYLNYAVLHTKMPNNLSCKHNYIVPFEINS